MGITLFLIQLRDWFCCQSVDLGKIYSFPFYSYLKGLTSLELWRFKGKITQAWPCWSLDFFKSVFILSLMPDPLSELFKENSRKKSYTPDEITHAWRNQLCVTTWSKSFYRLLQIWYKNLIIQFLQYFKL